MDSWPPGACGMFNARTLSNMFNRTLSNMFDNIQGNVLRIYDDKYEYQYEYYYFINIQTF